MGLVAGREGFRPVGGGFRASGCSEALCMVANEGLVAFTGGFRDLFVNGDGVRARAGDGDAICLGVFVAVTDLLPVGCLTAVGADAPFCSNIPIKDVVGGIGVVSKAWSELCEEFILLIDGVRVKLPGLRSFAADVSCWPVTFGLIDAEREAASVAAMKEADLD